MTLSPAQFGIFVLLGSLLVFITFAWLKPETIKPPVKLGKDISEWFAINITNTNIQENGMPKYEIHADRLSHYDQIKQTMITKPRAAVYNADTPPWQLRADKGIAYHASALEEMREIDLSGNVDIWREAYQQTPRSELQSEFLKFFPEQEYVETDTLVTFIHGKQQMSGVGMWADLKTQQVELHQNVVGHYIHE